jgi:hypothetical protein
MHIRPPESRVYRTATNNFATLIYCTAEILTLFLEQSLTNITSLYQGKLSQQRIESVNI